MPALFLHEQESGATKIRAWRNWRTLASVMKVQVSDPPQSVFSAFPDVIVGANQKSIHSLHVTLELL